MQLVEQHIVKDDKMIELCKLCKNLYNQVLYYWRQSLFKKIEYFSEYELTGLFAEFKEENYIKLPAQTSQQVIKLLFKNIKAWQKARNEYTKNPKKFLGKPQLPKYKEELSICIFTNQQISIKKGFIHFPKRSGLKPLKTKQTDIQQVRLVPKSNHIVVEVVYNVPDVDLKSFNDNFMGIDLGVNNLATCVTNEEAFIISGKPLKSTNHYYNKLKQYLQACLPENKNTSKRIQRITHKRNNKVKDYLHKASRQIIKKALDNDVTKIIIGKNKNWKQSVNLGKKTNRQFVSIPHAKFIDCIAYKAKTVGIEIMLVEEAYTSKCSSIDLEDISKHTAYLGKREKRGLFKTSRGFKINADANGGLNIARLGIINATGKDIVISDSVLRAVSAPKKIKI
jgi:putative transposase